MYYTTGAILRKCITWLSYLTGCCVEHSCIVFSKDFTGVERTFTLKPCSLVPTEKFSLFKGNGDRHFNGLSVTIGTMLKLEEAEFRYRYMWTRLKRNRRRLLMDSFPSDWETPSTIDAETQYEWRPRLNSFVQGIVTKVNLILELCFRWWREGNHGAHVRVRKRFDKFTTHGDRAGAYMRRRPHRSLWVWIKLSK